MDRVRIKYHLFFQQFSFHFKRLLSSIDIIIIYSSFFGFNNYLDMIVWVIVVEDSGYNCISTHLL